MFPFHPLEKYEFTHISMTADESSLIFLLTLRLFSIICHEIIPFQGRKEKSRVKHTAENALDIIIRYYHSLAMMSSHFHIISPWLRRVSFIEICLKATQMGSLPSLNYSDSITECYAHVLN